MKIAIHDRPGSYSDQWIIYCTKNKIPYKVVNAYDTDIIEQLSDCNAFVWHHSHADYRDKLFAKQLLYSVEAKGLKVFPDSNTTWHFDDKVGQKYLFESLGIATPQTYVFYDKEHALQWAECADFPKVFKLRGGAGAANVRLVRTKKDAYHLIAKAFGTGFPQYNQIGGLRERIYQFKKGKDSLLGIAKGVGRLIIPTKFSKIIGNEKGYVYFQDFIQNDGFDYRLEVCGDRAIAMVRYVRSGDFRASGGHNDVFDKSLIEKDVLDLGFATVNKLKMQSAALDIVRDNITKKLYVEEVSYCYALDEDEFLHGFWTSDGNFHDEPFDSRNWMIETVLS